MPTARSMARAGARVTPSVTSRLRGLMSGAPEAAWVPEGRSSTVVTRRDGRPLSSGSIGDVAPVRLRMSRTMLLPVVVFALCLLPVTFVSSWALLVLLVPALLALGVLRAGVTVGVVGFSVTSTRLRQRRG